MEMLELPDGELIPMSHMLTITWRPGLIQFIHIDNHAVYIFDWFAHRPVDFNRELNRTTREYMDYLNRNGIPVDED